MPVSPATPEDQNAKMAMKAIRQEIHRVLNGWDPLAMRGMRGFDMQYHAHVGPLSVMVRKRVPPMEIARHLLALMETEWKLPADREQCLKIAEKIWRTGSFLDPPK